MTLTKRDKKLLQFLAVFVILAGFIYFLILPQLDRMEELDDKIAEATESRQQTDMAVAQIPSYEQQVEEQQRLYNEAAGYFYEMTESHALERMITKLFLDHGLEAKDFEISAKPEYSQLEPYFASMLALETGVSDTAEENTAEDAQPEQTTVCSSQVSVKAQGDRANMEKLIDTIYANYPAMRVRGYDISTASALVGDAQVPSEVSVLELTLEVYMCRK